MGRRSRRRIRAGEQPPKQARPSTVAGQPDLARQIGRCFDATLAQFDVGEGPSAGKDIRALAAWWAAGACRASPRSPGLVPVLVCSYLQGELTHVWERGWQPADVPRVVGRHLSQRHARLAVDAIAEEAEEYRSGPRVLPSWVDQLDEIGAVLRWGPDDDHLARSAREQGLELAEFLNVAFELLVMIHHLPEIPVLCPPPSEWGRAAALDAAMAWRSEGRPAEARHLERVRALLAKAESTEFEEEADALTGKAQELMTRHSIDAALLAAHAAGRRAGEQPEARRIGVDDPYARAKALLLTEISEASMCRVVWSKDFGFSTVFGFAGDLMSVELLYTSLLVQARTAMAGLGHLGPRAKSRSFRQSFLVGFASRIGQRLREAADVATTDAVGEHGSELLPVLAGRSQAADALRDEAFPGLQCATLAATDRTGCALGMASADVASIVRGPILEGRASA